jgi:DNA-binding transcriptional ArsR family regulator
MTMSTVEHSATGAAEQLARELDGLSHPVRLRVVIAMDDGPASPTNLAVRLDVPLSTMSYHVRCLAGLGLLELVSSRPRRGALEHLYELTGRGHVLRGAALAILRDEPALPPAASRR